MIAARLTRTTLALALLAIAVAAGTLAVAETAGAESCARADVRGLPPSALATALVCLHNEYRARVGLQALRRSRALGRAARRHAHDMVDRHYFAHTSPDGLTPVDRARAGGYLRAGRFALGENILYSGPGTASARRILRQWLASPPHRANIRRGSWRDLGVGAVRGTPEGGEGITVVADFGARG